MNRANVVRTRTKSTAIRWLYRCAFKDNRSGVSIRAKPSMLEVDIDLEAILIRFDGCATHRNEVLIVRVPCKFGIQAPKSDRASEWWRLHTRHGG